MSRSLRTKDTQRKYNEFLKTIDTNVCRLCEMVAVKEFDHWKVVENEFPYDKIADKHVLLLTKRHCSESELSDEEKEELFNIKRSEYVSDYQFIFESTPSTMSIPSHYHLHLFRIIED